MIRRIVAIIIFIALIVIGIGWAGFRVTPSIDEPPRSHSNLTDRTALYDGLPPALQFYLQQTVGRAPWITDSALLWGTGQILYESDYGNVWLPIVWQEAIDVNRGFVWRGRIMWWKWPILDALDYWDSEIAYTRLGETVVTATCLPQAQITRTHATRAWLPSALIHDDITWSRNGNWSLVMRYPSIGGADSLTARFDSRTRALTELAGIRCKDDTTRATWRIRFDGWDTFDGVTVPAEGDVSWNDDQYYRFNVKGMAFNIPLDDWFDAARNEAELSASRY
jgi:hypothetical protein